MRKISVILIGILIIASFMCQNIFAQDLSLNEAELNSIKRVCPECIENNVMVCGNQHIGFGKRFYQNFFQGVPSRGLLITPPLLVSDFKELVRNETDYARLNRMVHDQFSTLKLIVVSPLFETIHVLSEPKVSVAIPQKLHDCLIIKNNRWGCGVADANEHECCEKKLGSPTVTVTWVDSITNERIELKYNPDLGATKVFRVTGDNTKTIYYCQISDPGKLKRKTKK